MKKTNKADDHTGPILKAFESACWSGEGFA